MNKSNNSAKTKLIFKISKDYPSLAVGEIEELCETKLKKLTNSSNSFYEGSLTNKNISKITKLGLSKNVFKVLKTINSINLSEIITELNSDDIKNDFKITSFKLDKNHPSTLELADEIHKLVPNNKVNLNNAKHNYVFIFEKNTTYFSEEIFENTDNTNNRRSHLRKINHPTSTHPKIAKAMINLANTDSFMDPFCGAGGLLIEGLLMNLKVKGSDISVKMIKSSKENLKALNLDCDLEIKDALTYNKEELKEYESIITDLPFGKNSLISKELNSLYEEFFILAENLTNKLVIGFESSVNLNELLSKTNWKIKKEFEYYVHKSMSRKIVILEI